MIIQPNQTPILATIVDRVDDELKSKLKIVLLNILEEGKMPAFLYVGRLLDADCLLEGLTESCSIGSMIHATIEVTGTPFNQGFVLSSVIGVGEIEEE